MRAIRCCTAVLIGVILIVLSSGSSGAEERSDEAALREIKEVLWPRAYAQQDVALLDSLLADEFQMVDADGNWSTKAEELDWIRSNPPSYDSLVFEIIRLDIFENGSAIVAGKGIVSGTDEQGPYTLEYQSTNVLIKREGAWKAVASHVSGIKRNET
jgi:ketosteroid isomerase-like protein